MMNKECDTNKLFITECKKEQWIVDRLIMHEACENIYIEYLDGEVLLCCEDCQEIILNFYRKGSI